MTSPFHITHYLHFKQPQQDSKDTQYLIPHGHIMITVRDTTRPRIVVHMRKELCMELWEMRRGTNFAQLFKESKPRKIRSKH